MTPKPLYIPNFLNGFIPTEEIPTLCARFIAEVPWINVPGTPRNEVFMSEDLTRTYTYGRQARKSDEQAASRTYTAAPMHPMVRTIMERLNREMGSSYNVAVGNCYMGKDNHLGWH